MDRGKKFGRFCYGIGFNTAGLGNTVSTVGASCCLALLEVFRSLGDEILVLLACFNDRIDETIDKSNLCPGINRNMEVRDTGGGALAGIGDNNLCTVHLGHDDPAACKGILFKRVAADDKNCPGFRYIGD